VFTHPDHNETVSVSEHVCACICMCVCMCACTHAWRHVFENFWTSRH